MVSVTPAGNEGILSVKSGFVMIVARKSIQEPVLSNLIRFGHPGQGDRQHAVF
jgi:hypothetical protein